MPLFTLADWLDYIASIHPKTMDLGLDRVKEVADRLDLLQPNATVIIVGGTNGKGSTVAGLDAIYGAAGYRVGTFTSPVLIRHNEYVHINHKEASDNEFITAYRTIESVRGDISLTPFEFHTLAALQIFKSHVLDVIILEVGLGGRLDAVNIIDADVSIVTSIGIDHVEWLGDTREAIAREKAGIFRVDKPAVCGDIDPPKTLLGIAEALYCQGRDFNYVKQKITWSWSYQGIHYDSLPLPTLNLQNMSTVLMAVTILQDRLCVKRTDIDKGLSQVHLLGRIEIKEGEVTEIFDVSHNLESVAMLANRLRDMPCTGKTRAVFSMLEDKDMLSCLQLMKPIIDAWNVAPLKTKRASSRERIISMFKLAEINQVTLFSSISDAYESAHANATTGDRVVIFGSFHTVAEAREPVE